MVWQYNLMQRLLMDPDDMHIKGITIKSISWAYSLNTFRSMHRTNICVIWEIKVNILVLACKTLAGPAKYTRQVEKNAK